MPTCGKNIHVEHTEVTSAAVDGSRWVASVKVWPSANSSPQLADGPVRCETCKRSPGDVPLKDSITLNVVTPPFGPLVFDCSATPVKTISASAMTLSALTPGAQEQACAPPGRDNATKTEMAAKRRERFVHRRAAGNRHDPDIWITGIGRIFRCAHRSCGSSEVAARQARIQSRRANSCLRLDKPSGRRHDWGLREFP